MIWTADMDALIVAGRGKQSAAMMAFELGCSRNAVLGRANRLGLPKIKVRSNGRPRRPKIHGETRLKPKYRRVSITALTEAQDRQIPFGQRKAIFELTKNTCRWPVGDPAKPDFFYCGAQPIEDRPYCAGHCAVAYENFHCVELAA